MSNFREYIKEQLKPSMFLTFDTDEYNPDTGVSTQYTIPVIIPDESNNGNHGSLYDFPVNESAGYELGLPSSAEKESDDCKAIRFGFHNPYNSKPKTYISVLASQTMIIPDQEFSLSFFYKRDDHYQGNNNKREVIIQRAGLFSISLDRGNVASNTERLYFDIYLIDSNNAVTAVSASFYNTQNKVGQDFFIVNCKIKGGNLTLDIYRNTRVLSHTVTSVGTRWIDTTNISTTYIGGLAQPSGNYDDRCIAPVILDQIAFYPFALSEIQIAGLCKRVFHYITLRTFEDPSVIILGNDANDYQNTIKSTGLSFSVRGNISKDLEGSSNVNLSRSVYLGGNSSLYATSGSNFIGSTNFSIDCWIKTSNDIPSILINAFSTTSNVANQLRVEFNRDGETRSTGVVQLRDEVDNVFIRSRPGFIICDGKWHHILINSTVDELQLYLDGDMHGKYVKQSRSTRYYSTMSLMGDLNNDHCVNGNLMLFYMRNSYMTNLQILTRYNYQISYLLRGRGLVNGNGTVSDLRIYDYETGELVTTDRTNSSGNYSIYLPNERNVSVNGLLVEDRSIIQVIRGPVRPISFSDQN